MVSVCTVPARGGKSCEHFGGYRTINRIPLPFKSPLEEIHYSPTPTQYLSSNQTLEHVRKLLVTLVSIAVTFYVFLMFCPPFTTD